MDFYGIGELQFYIKKTDENLRKALQLILALEQKIGGNKRIPKSSEDPITSSELQNALRLLLAATSASATCNTSLQRKHHAPSDHHSLRALKLHPGEENSRIGKSWKIYRRIGCLP
ncbi:hypothetical protein RB195_002620 [Necator americanus]|uniref:Uncharacterized protein n=1 Tax=Necator americanus TaxID=51031 RepID=A0ABR1DJW7_NECAM